MAEDSINMEPTEHGKPVALPSEQSTYERLVAQGMIQPATRRPTQLEPPVTISGTVSDLVGEQRR
jgi:hypothetical protein